MSLLSCIWDLEANKKTTDFCAHAGDVVSISLSPDGNTYITGSVDRTCKLWDLREENAKQTFFGHEADVNSVCVSIGNSSRCRINIMFKITFYSVPSFGARFRNSFGR